MKQLFFLVILILSFVTLKAQNEEAYSILKTRGEVCFSFDEKDREKINELSRIISIDKISKAGNIVAYANSEEFQQFLQKRYRYQIISSEKYIFSKSVSMASSIDEMQHWNRYPTYQTYLQLMESFQRRYPNLCKIDTIGYSVNNRLILSAEISTEDSTPKPDFFYSSTIHGDEVTGFVLMLRLIDYLVSNYDKDEDIKALINSVNIHINPNANPDGTYLSDNTISNAKRYNVNNVDLNRNYPNPFSTKTTILQPENEAMINYIKNHHFVMSANIHGGAEVLNFPWDSYTSSEKRPADSLWWIHISHQFVDTCKKYSPYSFSDTDISGITYGGDWYKVLGGRQDYINAALNLRELTMEISSMKILPADSLNFYWEMLRKPFLNYIWQATFGIRGEVLDSLTRAPLKAKIRIENHDDNESVVYSNSENGYFFRPIQSGTYDITFSADGFDTKTVRNVFVESFSSTSLSVELRKSENNTSCKIYPNPTTDYVDIKCDEDIRSITLYNLNGKMLSDVHYIIPPRSYTLDVKHLCSGVYLIIVRTTDKTFNKRLVVF